MNYNLSIDVCKLKNSGVGTIKGKRCIIVPVDDNHIEERNGRFTIRATMWERTNRETGEPQPGQYGDSHYLRFNVSKEVREAMTDEERRQLPYIGNAYPMQLTDEEPARHVDVKDEEVGEDLPF